MSFDKDIQDKFSGFEPEVPEAQIDAGWEKISYFLPPEEKKKRAFFFYRSAKGMGIVALALLMPAMAFWLLRGREKTGTVAALEHTTAASRPTGAGNTEEHSTALTPQADTNQGLETSSGFGSKQHHQASAAQRAVTSSAIVQASSFHSKVEVNQAKAGQISSRAFNADSANYAAQSALPHSQALANHGTAPASHPAGTGDSLPYPVSSTGLMMLLKQALLDQVTPLPPEPELAQLNANRSEPVPASKTRPALEFFSGLSHRSLMLKTGQNHVTVQANGFSAGLAGIFPLRPKFYLSGQFVFSYNPMQYHTETDAKEITRRVVVPAFSSSLTNLKDTFVYYVHYQSSFKLESSTAWHFSGGAGYQLLSKGRLSLDAALFLDVSARRFNYRISRLNADTGVFVNTIRTSNAASFYETVEPSDNPAPVSERKSMVAVGLNPCLSLIYQLNRRTGLVLRPAYTMQLTANTLQANGTSYRLRENSWFIGLGLRYRL